jgi:DNA repair protein SbcD/Mre11
MKPKPFIGFIKDTHLDQNNGAVVIDIFQQFVDLLKANGVKYAVHFGDFFSERTGGHNIERLMAVGITLRMFIEAEIQLFAIPGNHDKTDLESDYSYLNVYEVTAQSEYFQLFSRHDFVDFEECNLRLHFIPYFTEGEVYNQQLEEAIKFIDTKRSNILATHIAVNGAINNDGTIVETGIQANAFRRFKKVYSGHYHQEGFVPPNFYYFPSAYQANFGEDENKGFTILNTDLTITFHQSDFKRYKQLKVQVSDKAALREITKELKAIDRNEYNVRVKLLGSTNDLQAFDSTELKQLGVDIKKENTVETSIDFEEVESVVKVTFTKTELIKNYILYAKEFGFTPEQRSIGLGYLKTI